VERKWWTLLIVCIGTFMLLLDITVVAVALPDIQVGLHSSFSDLQWVVDAYSLTLAASLLTAGVLGDMFGRRVVYVVGFVVFVGSSLACGLATTSLMLILARGVQGVGAAVMFSTGLALLAQEFSGRERGTAFGVYGAVLGGALALGPLVGGAITSGISWRWIFFVNLPLGVVAIVLTLAKVRLPRTVVARRVDWPGFVTFTASLFMLVYALVQGNALGWRSATIIGLLVGAAVMMAAFLLVEWRRRDPMLELSLFRRPAMSGVSVAAFTLSASIFAMFLYFTLYLQEVLGLSPFAAGLRFLAITALSFLIAPLAGHLSVRVQSRYLMGLGLLLVAFGCALMTRVEADSTWTVLLPGFLVAGAGVGLTNPVLASATVAVVPPEKSGMASGISSTFRQVGIATGIAALGVIFLRQIRSGTEHALSTTAAGREVLQHGSGVVTAVSQGAVRQAAAALPGGAARDALGVAYRTAFAHTFDHLMAIATGVALVGALGSLVLVRQRDFVPSAAPGEEAPASVGQPPEAVHQPSGQPVAGSRRPAHARRGRPAPSVPGPGG
jgi:EmrB/QacA subfamily drug resistance transporter